MNRKGELFINDMDAFGMWGVCLSDSSLCSLVEPEPLKDAVSNKSSTEDGKQIRKETKPKVDERDITLFVQLYATSRDDMFKKLIAFKKELKKRRINIRTSTRRTWCTDAITRAASNSNHISREWRHSASR